MTENVCDSWEDVDVDVSDIILLKHCCFFGFNLHLSFSHYQNIVIKPVAKKKAPTTSATAGTTNSSFTIEENGGNIVVNSSKPLNPNANPFRIMPRANNATSTLNYAQACKPLSSYSSVATNSGTSNFDSSPFEDLHQPKVILEDDTRTQFVPKLRILNRPNARSEATKDVRTSEEIQRALKKSFEEKQAEYAKARLRILGALPSEEDVPESTETFNMKNISNTLEPAPASAPSTLPTTQLPINNTTTNDVAIIRQPTAPDGTRGFSRRSRS